jgi:hypothetical protein
MCTLPAKKKKPDASVAKASGALGLSKYGTSALMANTFPRQIWRSAGGFKGWELLEQMHCQ